MLLYPSSNAFVLPSPLKPGTANCGSDVPPFYKKKILVLNNLQLLNFREVTADKSPSPLAARRTDSQKKKEKERKSN